MAPKLPDVDMSRWSLCRMQVLVQHEPFLDAVEIRVISDARDIRSGDDATVVFRECVSEDHWRAAEPCRQEQLLRDVIARALMHELDECLHIDGTRVCPEPHPERYGMLASR